MSLRFSKVTLSSNGNTTSFLVGGIPKKNSDLQNWIAFKEFINSLSTTESVSACIETFLYGGEKLVDVAPEEIAYIYKRIEMRPDFIEKRTEKCGETNFII